MQLPRFKSQLECVDLREARIRASEGIMNQNHVKAYLMI